MGKQGSQLCGSEEEFLAYGMWHLLDVQFWGYVSLFLIQGMGCLFFDNFKKLLEQ